MGAQARDLYRDAREMLVLQPWIRAVTADVLDAADANLMHCLPANRGEEVTDDAIEPERLLVWQQAENRLHVQKALLVELLA